MASSAVAGDKGMVSDGKTPCDAVRSALASAAASRRWEIDVGCFGSESSMARPDGAAWTARLPATLTTGSSRMLVEALVQGHVLETIAVPLQLRVSSQAWVVTHVVSEGDRLAPADVALKRIEWAAGVSPVPPREEPPHGRARRALHAGQPLGAADIVADEQRLQGDAVTVLSRGPGFEVRAAATLVQAARPGELANAQIKGQRELVRGRLIDGNTIVLEP